MKPTIRDVAKMANVSITTVSFIMNGKKGNFNQATVQAVLDAVKELGYVPNRLAQNLSNRKSNLIALMVPDLTNPYYTSMAHSIMEYMKQSKINLAIIGIPENEEDRRSIHDLLISNTFDGALIVSNRFDSILADIDNDEKFNYVLLDESIDIKNSMLVTGDSELGGQLVAEHFIDNGHRRVGCITGTENTPNSIRRLHGFLSVMENHGYEIDDDLICPGNYTFEGGYKAAKNMINKDITGIFCLNDLMALGAISAVREKGLSVPDDISIIGYDNLEFCKYVNPKLTSVDQHVDQIGKTAISLLLDILNGDKKEHTIKLVNPTLVVGDTVKKIKGEM